MTAISRPARIGLITDQTGALSFMGIANVNVAKMVTDDINARVDTANERLILAHQTHPHTFR